MTTMLLRPNPLSSVRRYMLPSISPCRWCGGRRSINDPQMSPHIESLRGDAIEDGLPEDIRATVCDGCGVVELVGPALRGAPSTGRDARSCAPALNAATVRA
jgi:hypothetical protein